ncbi:LytTR family DNA-binding domain-containing protein [Massilia sp. Root335]|uniref:LytR/AlgR family response regulator transcription factor n=1 Tax=Massilia sp. Root335 TaxID=1736517 RepID=UPI000701031E|nr:response regulator [Massilia sp. Root335]KQV52292.1 two-component system response regulator [Massilia sp. Root335]
MRLLIVDDERPARAKLRHLLAQQDGIAAVDEAADGIEALERIAAFRPDALLLDIEMPELSGIELAASLPEPAPLVVFVTAYERYACQAFDADAIDYLLKPYDGERLGRALARLRKKLQARQDGQAALPPAPLEQLLVSERGVTRIVRVADIQWIETADNYVVLHTAEGAPLLRQTLAGLVERLGAGFVRCHRRAAVAVGWIERIVALDKGDGELQLRGGARVPCSRQYRTDVMARL